MTRSRLAQEACVTTRPLNTVKGGNINAVRLEWAATIKADLETDILLSSEAQYGYLEIGNPN